jgi:protein-S-isoprenylcysteine O-methyltransferase Ste14
VRLVLKNVLFTLVIPGTVGVYFPLVLARGDLPKPGLALPISLGLFAVAFAIYLWSVWHFASRGRATPLPIDAPKSLMVQGPYRYTRNPMYLALFSALLGWLLLYQNLSLLLYTIAVAALVTAFVIRYEEPHLEREFGDDYIEYKTIVPRWLPRLHRIPDA